MLLGMFENGCLMALRECCIYLRFRVWTYYSFRLGVVPHELAQCAYTVAFKHWEW